AKQGKYLKFKQLFWEKAFDPYQAARDPSKLGKDNIYAFAGEAGVDVEKLKVDMAGEDCKKHIAEDMAELAKFHVNSTPTLYVNGTVVGGAMPKENFKELIDAKLKLVEASGVKAGEYYDKEILAKGEKKFRSKLDPKP
ncbi:MAG: thioredoxin domain-containing protein, partial [Proteobacteria bacterium]|nr:thioredoxin domain-containing protein [Pseudomonadota bacterium]